MIVLAIAVTMAAIGLLALSVQNEGCLPWEERVGICDGPFGPQEDISSCK